MRRGGVRKIFHKIDNEERPMTQGGVRAARLCAVACLFALFTATAAAQGYPNRPIRFVVSFSAGSGSDTIARIVAGEMSNELGQQVVVENRGGAAGNIGADIASKAPPDGYTMFLANLGHAANATLYRKLPYDLLRDFAPVIQLAYIPSMVAVHPSLPAKTLADLVKMAKARPGAVDYGSGGVGSSSFLNGEIFKARAGIQLTHVPFKSGAEALTAVITGEVPIFFAPLSTTAPLAMQGRLRGLAVTSLQRVPILPEMPTVAESGYPGFQGGNWYGLLVPAKTSRDAVAVLNKAGLATLRKPAVIKRLSDLGFIIVGDQPAEFGAFLKSEVDSMGQVIRKLKISL
jgi:tripartite-type tricarboxylate transporter receptor subunit TctC